MSGIATALFLLIVFGTVLDPGETRSVSSDDPTEGDTNQVWHPPGLSREEWTRCHGMPCSKWNRIKTKLGKLSQDTSLDKECFLYTEEQVDELMQEAGIAITEDRERDHKGGAVLNKTRDDRYDEVESAGVVQGFEVKKRRTDKAKTPHRRVTRTLTATITYKKWNNPIIYKYDGTHTNEEQLTIDRAFQQWEQKTCLRFFEVNKGAKLNVPHIIVTKQSHKCQSFVGRAFRIYQALNLAEECMDPIGIPVHEIGHALGLWHTQQRRDRDDYVRINWDKVDYFHYMFRRMETVDHGIPYDYGSIMHYSWNDGSYSKRQTITPLENSQHKMSMGQRMEISFYDAKLINLEYCARSCRQTVVPPCRHGGYQDPLDCSRCRCPDGLAGTYCQEPAPAVNAQCGGLIRLAAGTTHFIQSPGYDFPKHYQDHTMCTWLIQAPIGYRLMLRFEGEFGAYCYERETCYHWVEVKNKTLGDPGLRFCCYKSPTDIVTSESNEMLVIFKSYYTTPWTTSKRGFRARIFTNPPGLSSAVAAPVPSPQLVYSTMSPGERWTPWSECQGHPCRCGGCSYRKRYRLCSGEICSYEKPGDVHIKACDTLCTALDTMLRHAGKIYTVHCPVCCTNLGYSPSAGFCVKSTS